MVGESAEGPLQIFCSYSHKDADLLDQFKAHTSILRRTGPVLTWTDREILPGSDWSREIASRLDSADIIVLLVSADFIASDYCHTKEMKCAMERGAAQEAKVVPVIVRPCLWQKAPFGHLQVLPPGGKAINNWPYRKQDSAWVEIAIGLSKIVEVALIRAQRRIESSAGITPPNLEKPWSPNQPLPITIQTDKEASHQKEMLERWRILQDTQKKIFEIQSNVTAMQASTQDKAFKKWDEYIRDA